MALLLDYTLPVSRAQSGFSGVRAGDVFAIAQEKQNREFFLSYGINR